MAYRVKFYNPVTGTGFIDGYPSAKRAKEVVEAYQQQFKRDGNKGVTAKYLGRDRKPQSGHELDGGSRPSTG